MKISWKPRPHWTFFEVAVDAFEFYNNYFQIEEKNGYDARKYEIVKQNFFHVRRRNTVFKMPDVDGRIW